MLEAITTKRCQEESHLESLETLGDSFLKYAVGQQLFIQHQNNHEGLLSIKKDRIVSNAALCKLGCQRKIAVLIFSLIVFSCALFHAFWGFLRVSCYVDSV